MADFEVRVSDLPGANPLSGIELVPMVQNGVTSTRAVQDLVSEGGLGAHIAHADPHPQYAFRVKNNLTATRDPGVNDDSSLGYEPTSRWVNTVTSEFFICVVDSVGAANWQQATLTLDELGSAALVDTGAGNGLDADLLDGQHGSYYQNATNLNSGTISDARLPATISSDITGNAATASNATKLTTPRTIALTGDVTGSVGFDGSANVALSATVGDDTHNHTTLGKHYPDYSAPFNDVTNSPIVFSAAGLCYVFVRASAGGWPLTYGKLLNVPGHAPNGGGALQILTPYSPSYNVSGNPVFRVGNYSTSTWSAWKEVVDKDWADSLYLGINANAISASKFATPRTINLGGDLSGSASFDGSSNITITATVADDSHNHIISNVDGLQTALDGKLGIGAKAADSDLLDGLTSTSFMRKGTVGSSIDNTESSALRFEPSVDNPTNTYYSAITFGNDSNVVGQLATHFTTGESYVRGFNTGWTNWRKLWDDTNFNPASKLDVGAKAADSNLLDGANSTSFLRSDTDDTASGWYTFTNLNGLETKYGIQGGYGDSNGSGSAWGANIWGMGNAYMGSGTGTSFVPGNYQLAWIREGSPYSGISGEGLYVYSQGALVGAMGRLATYLPKDVEVGGELNIPDGTVGSNATRNAIIQTTDPTSFQGVDGDICYVYTP